MTKPTIGAQLFTLRDYTKTLPEIAEVFRRVREMGYSTVQLSGGGFSKVDANEVAKLLNDNGLGCASTHVAWDRFLNNLDELIADHKAWGCKYPAIGGLPGEYRSVDGVKKFADEFAPVAEALATEGMQFSYHNHNHEFTKYDGKLWMDLAYELVPGLCFELDVYWVQAGGASPVAWINKMAGRCPVLHYKDMMVTPEREQRFAPIGEGNLDWPAIIEASEAAGAEFVLVEQDKSYDDDPFDCLATSARNLQAMGLR